MPRLTLASAASVLALALTACTGTGEQSAGPSSTPPATGAGSAASSAPTAPAVTPTATATFPSDATGAAMAWFVGQMSTAKVEADLGKRFSPEFAAQVPPEQMLILFGELRGQGPWVTENVTVDGNSGVATLVSAEGQRYTLSMQLDSQGKIAGALINSAAKGQTARSWEAVVERAKQAAPEVSVLAATATPQGQLTDVFAQDADTPRPVGSAFKLYVLAAVAEQVAAGKLGWKQKLTLQAEDKTLPSGELQNQPDGTTLTVQEAATKMISISDNTATNLLHRTVGEEAILAAARNAGNDHPEGITPFLTTKQMFWLSWGTSNEAKTARSEWKDANEQRRRELLAALPMPGPGPDMANATPQWRNGIEWFVSARDLADAHVYLQRLAAAPAGKPLTDVLGTNQGIEVAGWKRTAFKGGGNLGVMSLSFYATPSKAGPAQVLVMSGRGDEPVDQNTFVAAATDAANLLVAGTAAGK